MTRYTRGQFTITFPLDGAVAVSTVVAMLSQLKPGAILDDVLNYKIGPFPRTHRLVITYREPAAKGD